LQVPVPGGSATHDGARVVPVGIRGGDSPAEPHWGSTRVRPVFDRRCGGYGQQMVSVGYFLSCEEFEPRELVRQARLAEEAGFERLWICDRFRPWLEEQGQSRFVWSVIAALSQMTSLPIATAVTCPLARTHPAVIAQATATATVQCEGGFTLGVGAGEAFNEHVTGSPWPPPQARLEMLEEAIEVITLHTGEQITWSPLHRRQRPRLHDARLAGADLCVRFRAGRETGSPDGGWILRGDPRPGPRPALPSGRRRRARGPGWLQGVLGGVRGGRRPDSTPVVAQRSAARQAAHTRRLHHGDGTGDRGHGAGKFPSGPDPKVYLEQVRKFADAAFGPDQNRFFYAWSADVLPHVR
jgi:hypothetical protein